MASVPAIAVPAAAATVPAPTHVYTATTTFRVPAGSCFARFAVSGAAGGAGGDFNASVGGVGGAGAKVTARLVVSGHEKFTVHVGAAGTKGTTTSTSGGGGAGGEGLGALGGSGGGLSSVVHGGQKLIVAGGGGGGGAGGPGGLSGAAGGSGGASGVAGAAGYQMKSGDGTGESASGGHRGTKKTGGRGGATTAAPDGDNNASDGTGHDGSALTGGAGGSDGDGGGGGGGGLFGGGGGAASYGASGAGGGGGSSLVPTNGTLHNGVVKAAGKVTVRYSECKKDHPRIQLSSPAQGELRVDIATHPSVGHAQILIFAVKGKHRHQIATARTGHDGQVNKTLTESSGHTYRIRVEAKATKTTLKGFSKIRTIKVQ
jgi:hypothetical protein